MVCHNVNMNTSRDLKRVKVRVGPQGRVVIPAAVRQALGVEVGEELIMRVDDGRMVLERREDVVRRLRERFADVAPGRLLSEELISERREEARRETAEIEGSAGSSAGSSVEIPETRQNTESNTEQDKEQDADGGADRGADGNADGNAEYA